MSTRRKMRSRRRVLVSTAFSTLAVLLLVASASASPVRDLTEIRGVRDNQLVGYGLVVGLAGTGDSGQARFTLQSTAAMLRRLGATIDPSMIQTKNAAAVMVTATLPAHAQPGTRLDVTVSSLGNARSLLGGTLLQTPLLAADRNVYAVAQGPMVIGGFSAGGSSGSSVSLNHVTAGRVPSGAIVEREVPMYAIDGDMIELSLREPSFVTASRIVSAVDGELGDGMARAVDSGRVQIRIPPEYRRDRVGLVAAIQMLEVEPDTPSRVVIDERTGTVVLGGDVSIGEVAIAQGGLTIEISESFEVSQPGALAGGQTAVTPRTEVEASVTDNVTGPGAPTDANRGVSGNGALAHVPEQATLRDVVAALNALGAGPRDLIAIFQALRSAGALQAELEVQ